MLDRGELHAGQDALLFPEGVPDVPIEPLFHAGLISFGRLTHELFVWDSGWSLRWLGRG
jgi:hypothetical protein